MLKIYNQHTVETNLNILDVIDAVEDAYRLHAAGEVTLFPTVVHFFPGEEGDMDIKSGCVDSLGLMGMKMITYLENNSRKALPPLMGMQMLFDRATGQPLALVHAPSVTALRTGAAAAVGARLLARPDATTLLLLGCGQQAAACAAATLVACPQIRQVLCCCRSLSKAKDFAAALPALLRERYLAAIPADHPGRAAAEAAFAVPCAATTPEAGARFADIILTVTNSREAILQYEWLREGTHLSCIGADMEGKQELDPAIVAAARVFCDDIGKTSRYGEMQTAIRQGLFAVEQIAGELGEVIAGKKQGRTDPRQITLFDASGIAAQDILSAAVLLKSGCPCQQVDF